MPRTLLPKLAPALATLALLALAALPAASFTLTNQNNIVTLTSTNGRIIFRGRSLTPNITLIVTQTPVAPGMTVADRHPPPPSTLRLQDQNDTLLWSAPLRVPLPFVSTLRTGPHIPGVGISFGYTFRNSNPIGTPLHPFRQTSIPMPLQIAFTIGPNSQPLAITEDGETTPITPNTQGISVQAPPANTVVQRTAHGLAFTDPTGQPVDGLSRTDDTTGYVGTITINTAEYNNQHCFAFSWNNQPIIVEQGCTATFTPSGQVIISPSQPAK